MLNEWQRRVASTYRDGLFAGTRDWRTEIRQIDDPLFAFLMLDLSYNQGCFDKDEAIERVALAIRQLEHVEQELEKCP